MYIGKLNVSDTTYTHANSSVAYPPETVDGAVMWKWTALYDVPVDVNLSLGRECFVGAVEINLAPECLSKLQVLVDGKLSATYTAQTGDLFGGNTVVPVSAVGKTVTLRLFPSLKDVQITDISVVGSYDDDKPLVFPTPASIECDNGYVMISDIMPGNNADENAAADFLRARLDERFVKPFDNDGVPVTFIKLDSSDYDGERYTVDVSDDGIVVTAASRLALIYGADTVNKLYSAGGVRKCTVDDKPTCAFRGFHIGLPAKNQIEFVRRLFTYVFVPMRYNSVIVEFAGGMRFDKHPEISEAWCRANENYKKGIQPAMPHSVMVGEYGILEKDDVRRLVSYADDIGIEVIPEIQSLGHVQYFTYAHPELAEIDEQKKKDLDTRSEDARPDEFYAHCYCPSNPKTYEIMYDIIDEIIDVVRPKRYVHIGHDEVYQVGVCPVCRDKKPYELFADDVNKLYNYITEKGYKVMMWSDMLHPLSKHTIPTAPAIDLIPKDILMLDFTWYFHLDDDIETLLLDNGFNVAVGNLYSSHFPRYNSRIVRDGMQGGQISLWVSTNENESADNGKMWDACLVGQMLWNYNEYSDSFLPTYARLLADYVQPLMRENIRGTLDPCGYKAVKTLTFDGECVPYELKKYAPTAVLTKDASVKTELVCDRLVFNHATLSNAPRVPWKPLVKTGEYTVTYSDGTYETADVRYAGNILAYNCTYGKPMPQKFYRHQGYVGTWYADPVIREKAADGTDILTVGYVWDNPHPQKTIVSISYKDTPDSYAGMIVVDITAQKK